MVTDRFAGQTNRRAQFTTYTSCDYQIILVFIMYDDHITVGLFSVELTIPYSNQRPLF